MKVKQIISILIFGILSSMIFNVVIYDMQIVKYIFLSVVVICLYKIYNYDSLVYSAIFSIPFNFYLFDMFSKYTVSYLHILLLVTSLKLVSVKKRKYSCDIQIKRIFLPVIVFLVFGCMSLLWSNNLFGSFKIFLRWCLPVIFFYMGYIEDSQDVRNSIKMILFSGIIICIIAIFQWIAGRGMEGHAIPVTYKIAQSKFIFMFIDHDRVLREVTNWTTKGGLRAFGTFGNANNMAGFLGLVYYLYFAFQENAKDKNTFKYLYILYNLFVLLFIGSVTGIIAFTVSFLVFILIKENMDFKKIYGFIFIIFFTLIVLTTRFLDVRGFVYFPLGLSLRIQYFFKAINYMLKHPFGSSFGEYQAVNPHNIILLVGVFLGWIGMVLFIWMIGRIFYDGIRIYKQAEDTFNKQLALAILCGFVWFFIHAQADNIYIGDNIGMLFWLEVGILYSLGRDKRPSLNPDSEASPPDPGL